jgi:hypothetical protein
MSKRQMIEKLIDAHEFAISAGEQEECARQFVIWLDRVASSLVASGMVEEHKIWKEAQATVQFYEDDNSFPAQSESMRAILIAMLDKLNQDESFVNVDRLNELRAIESNKFDLAKLIRLSEELNACYANDCFFAVALLVRAILDHVPPIFECRSFTEICNNYSGGKSFKETMMHLDNSCRKIADAYLHFHIRDRESLPNKTQVDFSSELDVLLGEIARKLRE